MERARSSSCWFIQFFVGVNVFINSIILSSLLLTFLCLGDLSLKLFFFHYRFLYNVGDGGTLPSRAFLPTCWSTQDLSQFFFKENFEKIHNNV